MDLVNAADAFVSQLKPSTKYGGSTVLKVRAASGELLYAYVKHSGMPTVPGAVIDSAVLRIFATGTQASHTITARDVAASWSAGGVKWSNRPAAGALSVAVTKSSVKGTAWDFNVLAMVTAWTAGAPNYGIRLETSSTASGGRGFYSSNATGSSTKYHPVLIITWSAPPSTPSGFVATGGAQVSVALPVLPWNYSDPAGLAMAAYQFQSNTANSWGAPAYDSNTTFPGGVPSSVPQHTTTDALADGATRWYRVRHKNSAGKWSPWSPGQEFGRTVKPTVAVTDPSGATIGGYTPTYAWSQSAGTQTSFRADTLNPTTLAVLDSSGEVSGTSNDYETEPLPIQSGAAVRLRLRVTDDVDRVATPGDPTYIEVTEDYTLVADVAIPNVTALVVAASVVGPTAVVTWTTTPSPDGFVAERRILPDGEWSTFQLDLGDVSLGGTSYAWVDATALPRRPLEYRVRAVVDGVMGDTDLTATITLTPIYIWLVDPDDPSWVLPLAGQDGGTWGMGEQSTILEVRGSDRVILIHEGSRGYEGSISGSLHSGLPQVGDATAQDLRDRAWRLKAEPVKVWRLVLSDMNIPVVVRNVVPAPTPGPDLSYIASLEFYQQGEIPWL